jgi:hypothetical protein
MALVARARGLLGSRSHPDAAVPDKVKRLSVKQPPDYSRLRMAAFKLAQRKRGC